LKELSKTQMEQVAGGFSGNPGVTSHVSSHVLNLAFQSAEDISGSFLSGISKALAEPLPLTANTPSENYSTLQPQSHILQSKSTTERWERYKPQQPSFRSRFINR